MRNLTHWDLEEQAIAIPYFNEGRNNESAGSGSEVSHRMIAEE